jgi:hypothetical protein
VNDAENLNFHDLVWFFSCFGKPVSDDTL